MDIIERLNELQGKLRPETIDSASYKDIRAQLIKIIDDNNLSVSHKKTINENPNYANSWARLTKIDLTITSMKSEIAKMGKGFGQGVSLEATSKPKVFVSHASVDKDLANCVINNFLLKAYKLTEDDIFCTSKVKTGASIGGQWNPEIRSKLESAEIVIFLLTEDFRKSAMCLDEIGAAWGLQKKIIPLIIPPTQFSHFSRFVSLTNGIDITVKENVSELLKRTGEDFAPLTKMIPNESIDSMAQAFIQSLKLSLRSKSYFLKEGEFYTHSKDVFLFYGSKLLRIPNLKTAVLLGLKEMPGSLSKKAYSSLEVGETIDSIILAPVFEVSGSKRHWVLLNNKLHHIPNKPTRDYIGLKNYQAKNPTKMEDRIFHAIPKGSPLTLIKDHDISKQIKQFEKVKVLFGWSSDDVDSGSATGGVDSSDRKGNRIHGFVAI